MFPAASKTIPPGLLIFALLADAPSPPNVVLPDPTKVLITELPETP